MIKFSVIVTFFTSLIINVSVYAAAQENMHEASTDESSCIITISEFFGVKAKEEKKIVGSNTEGLCELTAAYRSYISGNTNELTARFVINVDEKIPDIEGEFRAGVWTSVNYNYSGETQTIYKCDVSDTELNIEVKHALNFGRKQKYTHNIKVNKNEMGEIKSVYVSETQKGFTPSSFEKSCKF
ncbi:MAG: hypothetical protein H6625_11585 [Bdellovibrionaceae bacterium]|nr:hypothetical protein [Pseudobdellovibrionaceae bacterium]